jgi:hypothetical protein
MVPGMGPLHYMPARGADISWSGRDSLLVYRRATWQKRQHPESYWRYGLGTDRCRVLPPTGRYLKIPDYQSVRPRLEYEIEPFRVVIILTDGSPIRDLLCAQHTPIVVVELGFPSLRPIAEQSVGTLLVSYRVELAVTYGLSSSVGSEGAGAFAFNPRTTSRR